MRKDITRLLLVAGVLAVILIVMVQGVQKALHRPFTPPGAGQEPVQPPAVSFKEPVNLLVLGADQRPGDPGRSDSILLVSFDATQSDHPVVRLMSLQRDTWADIPGHGHDKLNHAFAFGGVDLAKKAVERLINLPLDHTVVVNMAGFEQVVNTLGGVDIDVAEQMDYDDPVDSPPLHIHFEPGLQRMTGRQALLYARYRHDDLGDFGRMQRQQQVLRALAKEATKPENVLKIPNMLKAVQQAVATDLTYGDLLQMALAARKVKSDDITSAFEGGKDRYIDGVYYLEPDLVALRTAAFRTLTGKEPDAAFLQRARQDQVALTAALPDQHQVALAPPPEQSDHATGQTTPPAPERTPAQITVGLRDGTEANLWQVYAPYVAQGGYRVVPLGNMQPLDRTMIVLHTPNSKLQEQMKALFQQADVEIKPDPQAETPVEIWLGKDLSDHP